MPTFPNVFAEVAALLLLAAGCGAIALLLRQPVIVAFIAVGILAGPAGLNWVHSADQVDLLAKLGIALLLFVVGLKLDVQLIRSMGKVALATGLGQVLFTSATGFGLCLLLGLDVVPALYVGIALTFSSTIIIVKLLSDKREIDALHGRIAVGFLIVQDIVVVMAMIVLSAFAGETAGAGSLGVLSSVLVTGGAFLTAVGLAMRYLLPGLLTRIAVSSELLVLFAIAWGVSLASLGDVLGFSKEIGAFVAGVSLASSPFREAIASRLVSLRDFLLLFFFLTLGAQQDLQHLGAQLGPAAVLSLFVLVGNPLIVMIIMGWMGYRKRTSFLAGLTVAQISEFSLILGAMALRLGHIDAPVLGLITLVGLITIGVSTYMILYSHQLYHWLGPWLGLFERRILHAEGPDRAEMPAEHTAEAIIFGLGRYGSRIGEGLRAGGWRVLGIDFDPHAVQEAARRGWAARYGDAEDPELLRSLPLIGCRWVVCASPWAETNAILLDALRQQGYRGRVALTARIPSDAARFTRTGADLILCPHLDAADRAVEQLLPANGTGSVADNVAVRHFANNLSPSHG
ncbi:MAG: cation:proton antiporter [Nitrospira sp.]|nr:cation:proton antiporter [Nitrospira sp.]